MFLRSMKRKEKLMKIVCSPAGILNPYCPGQGIMDLANAGFAHMSLDLDLCCPASELEDWDREEPLPEGRRFAPVSHRPEEMRRIFQKTVSLCHEKQIQIPIAKAPHLPRKTKREDMTERLLEITKEAVEYCGTIGCGSIIVRPLEFGRGQTEGWGINRSFFLGLSETACRNQVMILLENGFYSKNGGVIRGACSDGETAAQWIDSLNREAGEECFGFCLDVGTLSLCGQDMGEMAAALGKRIKAVTVRDGDGRQESSMLPFTAACGGKSRTDWLGFIRGMRQQGFDGLLVLNMFDTAASFSPILRPGLMSFAKSVAEYLKWQIEIENLLKKYDSIALFGAGNMCRNYMKCYGKDYKPLFTCDNNEKMWGSFFCGLEVKPPEALKTVPENCGVFICNIYYREIEKQLRDMGVKNIEFFNDEYMPSFYFDRLKGV